MNAPSLFISAGDPSGDNAASRLVVELRNRLPNLELFGLGGPRLKFLGQEQLAEPGDLAVLGFWEVARRFFFFRKLMHRTVSEIRRLRPRVVLLVDYPGFNLRLAKRIRSLGIPVIYYISPQVWAWGKKRIGLIREVTDLMLVILPFEQAFFDGTGVNCKFVGHYLLDDIPGEFIGSPLPSTMRLALLPGSRRQEIERMLPTMLRSAELISHEHQITTVVAAVSGIYDYEEAVRKSGLENVTVVYDEPRRVVHESSAVLTASGTATLETGIIGRPMVIIYKTGWITYQIARRLVKLGQIGLVNLVLGDTVVPELIQHDANPSKIAELVVTALSDSAYKQKLLEKLNKVPGLLGGSGASLRAAKEIEEFL